MSLTKKLITLYIVFCLLPFMLVGTFAYFLIRDGMLDISLTLLSEIGDRKKTELIELLQKNLASLPSIKSEPELGLFLDKYPNWEEDDQSRLNTILASFLENGNDFRKFFIMDSSGMVISSTDPSLLGSDYSEMDLFQIGRRGLRTNIFREGTEGEALRYFVSPMNVGGQSIGVLAAEMEVRKMFSITHDFRDLGKTGEVLLWQTNADGSFTFLTPTRFDQGATFRKTAGIDFERQKRIDYRGIEVLAFTTDVSGATYDVADGRIMLVVKKDLSEVLAPLNRSRFIFVSSSIAFAIILMFVAMLVIRSILRPVRSLMEASENIASGDLSQKVDIKSEDEIGNLASAFNRMSERLSERSRDLNKKKDDLKRKVKEIEEVKNVIEQEKSRSEAILFNMGEGLVAIDENGIVLVANERIGKILKRNPQEIVGSPWEKTLVLYKEDGGMLKLEENPIQKVFKTKERIVTMPIVTRSMRYFMLNSDGDKIPVQITASHLNHENSISVIAVFRDITSEFEFEHTKAEFVSLASHELRTPLSTSKWYVEMILGGDGGPLTPKQIEYLKEVDISNQRMAEIVDSLLSVSRIEMGGMMVEPVEINIGTVIKDILKNLSDKIYRSGATIEEDYSEDVPRIKADRDLLRVVVRNLLANAIRYTKDRVKISIAKAQMASNEDGKGVRQGIMFSVSDNGIGIPNEHHDKIFTKLFRSNNAKLHDPEGVGLGLFITKSIIDQTGGDIWFDSREGVGTDFYVFIPIDWELKRGDKLGYRR